MISSLRTGIPGQRQELWQIGQGHRVLGLSGALQALCALLLVLHASSVCDTSSLC